MKPARSRARGTRLVSPVIDLLHEGLERVIGVYLLETEDGLALFDCGPASALPALERGLRDRGLALGEIRHLLLSHIHLDHAGATGVLIRAHPDLQVHVSEVGAEHLVDPTRLERSARRLYGERFDELWGELAAVPAANVHPTRERVLGLECFPTPGHASHHVCYLDGDDVLLAGDAVGVRIPPGRHVMPAAPPPDIDLDAWRRSLDEIERREPERLALIHFGVVEDAAEHLAEMRGMLELWAERVEVGMTEEQFVHAARWDLTSSDEPVAALYQRAAPFSQSYAGLRRYWDKRREAEAAEAAR